LALDNLVNKYGNQVAAIAVYNNGGNPPFFNQTALRKILRYYPPYWVETDWYFGTPWLWCDGNNHAAWQTSSWNTFIGQRVQVPQDMDLEIYGQYNAKNYTLDLQFQLKNTGAKPLTGRLHCVLTEDKVVWSAPNEQQVHNHIPRIWWPDEMGRAVTLPSGGTTMVSASWSLDKAWNADNLKVVAFVQDTAVQPDSTCAVFQGASQKVIDIQSDVHTDGIEVARNFQLFQNTPNPFNPSTIISFMVPEQSLVQVSVYDVCGKKHGDLLRRVMPAGSHSVVWDGKNEAGRPLPSGVYILMLQAGRHVGSIKMTLLR
jgi:hypothetical protein